MRKKNDAQLWADAQLRMQARIPREEQLKRLFSPKEYHSFMDKPVSDPVVKMDDRVIAQCESLTAIFAQAGEYKSTIATLIENGFLLSNGFPVTTGGFTVTTPSDGLPGCRIDTEQSEDEIKIAMSRRLKLIGQPNLKNYSWYAVKGLDQGDILDWIDQWCMESFAQHGGISFMVIDGVGDLCDVNDKKESDALVKRLERLTSKYNFPMFLVLHQNPGSIGYGGSDKGTGHLGTKLERKCGTVLTIKVKNGDAIVSCNKKLRAGKRGGADHLYRWDDDLGFLKFVGPVKVTKPEPRQIKTADVWRNIEHLLAVPMKYTDLVNAIISASGSKSRRAKEIVKELQQLDFIVKNENWYHIKPKS